MLNTLLGTEDIAVNPAKPCLLGDYLLGWPDTKQSTNTGQVRNAMEKKRPLVVGRVF